MSTPRISAVRLSIVKSYTYVVSLTKVCVAIFYTNRASTAGESAARESVARVSLAKVSAARESVARISTSRVSAKTTGY